MPGPVSATISRPASALTVTAPAGRRLAQRVLDEVRRDLQQPVVVALDPGLLAVGRERDAELLAPRPRAARTASRATSARSTGSLRTENSLRFMRARSSRSRTSRSSRPRLEPDDRARASSGVERSVGQALGVAADRRQRRLQLVADREQEVPLGLARGRELLRHLVERLRERGDLGRSLLRQRLVRARPRRARGSRRRRGGSAARSSARSGTRAPRRAPRPRARRTAGRAGTASTRPSAGSRAAAGAGRATGSSGTSRGSASPA